MNLSKKDYLRAHKIHISRTAGELAEMDFVDGGDGETLIR